MLVALTKTTGFMFFNQSGAKPNRSSFGARLSSRSFPELGTDGTFFSTKFSLIGPLGFLAHIVISRQLLYSN